jgi:hypothetical protein
VVALSLVVQLIVAWFAVMFDVVIALIVGAVVSV